MESRYTGLFRSLRETAPRAYDPDVAVWSGVPANRPWPAADAVGGAGWTDEAARLACVGEAIERWQTHALSSDRCIRATYAGWATAGAPGEAAIDPRRFVRFSDEQYARPDCPFQPLTATTELEWVACRAVATGEPLWVPADLVFMDHAARPRVSFGPAISTGWAAHATPGAAFEAAVRELVERDAVVGAWWGHYPLRRLATAAVRALLGGERWSRLARGNLEWRFYAIESPYSPHVTLATTSGLDAPDASAPMFAIGSACRLDRAASLEKAALEAVQGRHYVRYLLTTDTDASDQPPTAFAEHASYYSRHPERLATTCLARADAAGEVTASAAADTMRGMLARLPPLAVRMATPPALGDRGFAVVRVIAPELQPLHGDHRWPFLGGPLWGRPLADYTAMPPHPFA